jgi:hypothetical protein
MTMRTCIAVVAWLLALALPAQAQAQALPLPKVGACPSGYRSEASYCVPLSDRAPPVVIKSGQCPSGWRQSGSYCIPIRQ